MKILDFKPMPEEEEDLLMAKVGDMMENGGRMPQEVTNEFLWAQGTRTFNLLRQTRNTVRFNWLLIRALGVTVALIVAFLGLMLGDEFQALFAALP